MDAGTTERTLGETLMLLPHAYPFRFLDRIIEINETSAVAVKTISADDFFFVSNDGIASALPALLIAEALAQLSGLVMAHAKADSSGAFLAGITNLNLKRPARIGERLRLQVETIISFETMAKFSAKATIGEEEILRCELTMAVT